MTNVHYNLTARHLVIAGCALSSQRNWMFTAETCSAGKRHIADKYQL